MYPIRSRVVPPETYQGYAGLGLLPTKKGLEAAKEAKAIIAVNAPLCKEANATGLNMGQDLCNPNKMGGLENFLWIITRYGTSGQPPIPEPWNTWLTGDASLKWEQSDEYRAAIAFADHLRVESRNFISEWNSFISTVKSARSGDWWTKVRGKNSDYVLKTWNMVVTGKRLLDRKAELDEVIKATTQKMFIPEAYKGKKINKVLTTSGRLDIQVLDSDNRTVLKTGLSKIDDAHAWVDEFIAKEAQKQAEQVAEQQGVQVQPGVTPGTVPGETAPADDAAKKKKTALIVGGGAAAALLAMVAAR